MDAHRKICGVYVIQKWIDKLRSGDMSLENGPPNDQLTEVYLNDIKALMEQNQTLAVQEIAEAFKIGCQSL